jgi:hypothetical protein
MKSERFFLICLFVMALLLVISVGVSAAKTLQQDPQPEQSESANAALEYKIPIQGRLTNAGGSPLTGDYNLTLRMYSADTGGTPICEDSHLVSVNNGLFNTAIEGCAPADIDGQQLYLGIEVESDGEMTPRLPIYPVPYAYSLIPGAEIRGNITNWSMLRVFNEGDTNSTALAGIAESTTGTNTGVLGWSNSADGVGGRFRNDNGGIALKATGSGIFQSSAKSYIFVPAHSYVKLHTNSLIRHTAGNEQIRFYSGGSGQKVITIPITMPGVLYGQQVRVTEMAVYYKCENGSNNFINSTSLYKYVGGIGQDTLINNPDDRRSNSNDVYYLSTSSSTNTLSVDYGFLLAEFAIEFVNDTEFVSIIGIRLTLEHN